MPPEAVSPSETDAAGGGEHTGRAFPRVMRRVALYAFGVVAAALGIVLILSFFIDEEAYSSNKTNIRFTIPVWWELVSPESTPLPIASSTPHALLESPEGCVIAYASVDREVYATLKQISFADRIYSGHWQFDGSWYIPKVVGADTYTFRDHERQFLPGEMRISHGLYTDAFILFTKNGDPVPESCNRDLNQLLRSAEPHFAPGPDLTAATGELSLERVHTGVSSGEPYNHLVFTDSTTGERSEVMRLPDGAKTSANVFIVDDRRMYMAVSDYPHGSAQPFAARLVHVDPFTRETATIPGSEYAGVISSLYVRGDQLFFIRMPDTYCLDTYDPCDASLYSMPIGGGTPALVAEHVPGGSILGMDSIDGSIYLGEGWGDAGECVVHFVRVHAGKSTPIDPLDPCSYTLPEAVAKQFEKTAVNRVLVSNGRLTPGAGGPENLHGGFFFGR